VVFQVVLGFAPDVDHRGWGCSGTGHRFRRIQEGDRETKGIVNVDEAVLWQLQRLDLLNDVRVVHPAYIQVDDLGCVRVPVDAADRIETVIAGNVQADGSCLQSGGRETVRHGLSSCFGKGWGAWRGSDRDSAV